MTEKNEVEETEEMEDTLDDQEVEETEEVSEAADEGVEEEEGQEDDLKDEHGVPYKNRMAEFKRKYEAEKAANETYKELITNLNQGTKKEQEAAAKVLESFSADDFAKVNIDADTADFLLKAFNREIDKRIAEADGQNRNNRQINQEFARNRIEAIKDAQDALTGEFGDLVEADSQGGIRYAADSPLYKRAKEIFERSPKLQNLAAGPAIAAQRAEVELTREKYGKGNSKPKSKAEKLKGGSASRGGGTTKAVKVGGKFHRKLTIPEWDKLSSEDQSAYNIWQTDQDTK